MSKTRKVRRARNQVSKVNKDLVDARLKLINLKYRLMNAEEYADALDNRNRHLNDLIEKLFGRSSIFMPPREIIGDEKSMGDYAIPSGYSPNFSDEGKCTPYDVYIRQTALIKFFAEIRQSEIDKARGLVHFLIRSSDGESYCYVLSESNLDLLLSTDYIANYLAAYVREEFASKLHEIEILKKDG